MEQILPIEQVAEHRLNIMVNAFSLFVKNLMEEGVDLEKVKRASDRAWQILGQKAGEQMKPLFAESGKDVAAKQAGMIARQVHGMESEMQETESGHRTEFTQCPWHTANQALGIPEDWRMCVSGHASFTEQMFKAMYPEITAELKKTMPGGDSICEEFVTY